MEAQKVLQFIELEASGAKAFPAHLFGMNVERELFELKRYNTDSSKYPSLPEAKGPGETKEQQQERLSTQIQELLTRHEFLANLPNDKRYREYNRLKSLKAALDKKVTSVATNGKLYAFIMPQGRISIEDTLAEIQKVLSGPQR